MSFLHRLWRCELTGFAALVVCAVAVAVVAFGDSVRIGDTSLASVSVAARIGVNGFGYTVIIGALPVILYGAPIYALLANAGRANWTTVILLGVVPGVFVLPFDVWPGVWAIGCGVIVASITHLLMGHWTRHSNSVLESDAQREALRAPQHGR